MYRITLFNYSSSNTSINIVAYKIRIQTIDILKNNILVKTKELLNINAKNERLK